MNEDDKMQDSMEKKKLSKENEASSSDGAKYAVNPNGEAKIDIEVPQAFSGLTKEELMKFSNDPFWVRLRWVLFILFWLGWVVMLFLAIMIIIQTPGCKPPPTIMWIEEQTAVHLDLNDLGNVEELTDAMKGINVKSVYIPALISPNDFQSSTPAAIDMIKQVTAKMMQVITDLPSSISVNNPLYNNASDQNIINADGSWNYANEALPAFVKEAIISFWMKQGVTGFIVGDKGWEAVAFKELLNEMAKDEGSDFAVANKIVDTEYAFQSASDIKAFLEDQGQDMNFYQFSPNFAAGSDINREDLRLITMGMFLIPGTVIIKGRVMTDRTKALVRKLIEMKSLDSIKFATTNFVNSTTANVIAFTRVYKGTPAYAVALNFNNRDEAVSFASTPYIGDVGTTQIISQRASDDFISRDKYDLGNITLGPFEGIVLQFVANF